MIQNIIILARNKTNLYQLHFNLENVPKMNWNKDRFF
jgi:hypothetical protein